MKIKKIGRVSELFDVIVDFPESKTAISDLVVCLILIFFIKLIFVLSNISKCYMQYYKRYV
jgi:hypothetical protein